MEITYISSFDASNINSYSGTGYYIPYKLHQAGDSVSYIGNLSNINPISQRLKRKAYSLMGKNYLIERNPHVLDLWAREIKKKLNGRSKMLVSYSSQPFARLQSEIPKIFWTDAVFASMIDYYPVYSNLCSESIHHGNLMEKLALQNASCAVYSSDWAAQEAIRHYDISPSKIRVVPFGANIEVEHAQHDISEMASSKSKQLCRLLFLGVEWFRKGGDIAVKVAEDLNRKGLKTELSIVGVEPAEEVKKLDFVKSYGFISKSDSKAVALFRQIIRQTHFLLLPTRADCTPIVFSEMNAHGIPVITTNEGGIPSMITNGVNGFMLNKDSPVHAFSELVLASFTNWQQYIQLAESSFNEYKTKLNWEQSIPKFRRILEEFS